METKWIDVNKISGYSTMPDITAQACKDLAKAANENKFLGLLSSIADEARTGKYIAYVDNLPKDFEEKLTKRKFIVRVGNVYGFNARKFHTIMWK